MKRIGYRGQRKDKGHSTMCCKQPLPIETFIATINQYK